MMKDYVIQRQNGEKTEIRIEESMLALALASGETASEGRLNGRAPQDDADPIESRRREYQSMDDELLHSLVEVAEQLGQNGIQLPPSFLGILTERKKIKKRYPKILT